MHRVGCRQLYLVLSGARRMTLTSRCARAARICRGAAEKGQSCVRHFGARSAIPPLNGRAGSSFSCYNVKLANGRASVLRPVGRRLFASAYYLLNVLARKRCTRGRLDP